MMYLFGLQPSFSHQQTLEQVFWLYFKVAASGTSGFPHLSDERDFAHYRDWEHSLHWTSVDAPRVVSVFI